MNYYFIFLVDVVINSILILALNKNFFICFYSYINFYLNYLHLSKIKYINSIIIAISKCGVDEVVRLEVISFGSSDDRSVIYYYLTESLFL